MWRFAALLFLLTACNSGGVSPLEIENAWIRQMPPGSGVSALYFEINNRGSEPDKLLSVNSPVSDKAEIHSTVFSNDNGTAKMVKLQDVAIPAGEKISFSPGGIHIMLINIKGDLISGHEYDINAEFENSGTRTFKAKVRGMGGEEKTMHH